MPTGGAWSTAAHDSRYDRYMASLSKLEAPTRARCHMAARPSYGKCHIRQKIVAMTARPARVQRQVARKPSECSPCTAVHVLVIAECRKNDYAFGATSSSRPSCLARPEGRSPPRPGPEFFDPRTSRAKSVPARLSALVPAVRRDGATRPRGLR